MRKKGRKYRNLTVRGRVIQYEREVEGKRLRFSTKTTDWDEAAAVMARPGATSSGFCRPSRVGPRLENQVRSPGAERESGRLLQARLSEMLAQHCLVL